MSETFKLKVVASDKPFYDGECQILVIPAADGERAVLAHHENMIIAVVDGELRIQNESGEWTQAVTGRGFVQVYNNNVTMLASTVERLEDIDEVRAREAKERAEERLRQQQSLQEYYHTQASIRRAMTRLKYKDKYGK